MVKFIRKFEAICKAADPVVELLVNTSGNVNLKTIGFSVLVLLTIVLTER